MSLNINEIVDNNKQKISWIREIRDFLFIFTIIFGFGWLFINAQLLLILIDNISGDNVVQANEVVLSTPKKSISMADEKIQNNLYSHGDNLVDLKKKLLDKKVSSKLDSIHLSYKTDKVYKPSYDTFMKDHKMDYSMTFNTMAPDARLVIPKIGVNVHVVRLSNIPMKTIYTANYDKYLYDGVVKYPYTPNPGQKGNIFIFGHTSYYWWKKNPYGTVFSKIPRLKHGDYMNITWQNKVYKYKVFKKLVVRPSQVPYIYKKYSNGEYLTIMGCYPIGSDRQRMLIIAKRE